MLQCRTPYAAVHTLVLLMMGIMMPKTCCDKSLIINIRLVASCWFLSLHPKSSPLSHPICVRHILILSSQLCSGLTNGLLPSSAKYPVHLTLHFIQYLLQVQLMKLFDIQFSPSAYYQFLPLRSRHSRQNPCLKHPQHISPFF